MPDMQGIVQNIVISRDKSIYVPEIIKKSIVQRDHNVDRLTFDCPRYWNGIDISKLNIYVNYIAAGQKKQGEEPESFLCENVVADEDNPDIFHFDWRITSNVSEFPDKLIFIVCAKSVDAEGNEELHWNSRLCTDLEVQEGLEASAAIVEKYPDVIEQILSKLGKQIEFRNSGKAIQYRNAGENIWVDLVQLEDIKGDAAVIVESNFKGSDTTENILAKTGETGDKWYSTDEGVYYMINSFGEWINCGSGENLKKIEDEIDALKGDIEQLKTTEPADDDIPKVFFNEPIPQTKDDVVTKFRYISKTMDISGYAEFKAQGNSSMRFPKKNITVKLYKDINLTEKMKIDFRGWGKQSKFCLKANWIDITHSRNVVGARLWKQICDTRKDTLPSNLQESPKLGAVDGFPIKVYSQGIYQGRYSWNIPKDKWTFNMDDSLENHVVLCGESNDAGTPSVYASSSDSVNGTYWSDEIHDIVPESVVTAWNRVLKFVNESTDEEFKNSINDYIDIQSVIDYLIFNILFGNQDAFGKNQLVITYDLAKWFISAYDMDQLCGLDWLGAFVEYNSDYPLTVAKRNNLILKTVRCFPNEITARYGELRNSVLTVENVINEFERWTDICPISLVNEDFAETTADGAFVDIPSKETNTIQRIRKWVTQRFTLCDTIVPDFGLIDRGDDTVYYTVSNNLTNCTNSNSVTSIKSGEPYNATISANGGYALESITCTMGGVNQTVVDGVINIASVTGDLVITAVATVTEQSIVFAESVNDLYPFKANTKVNISDSEMVFSPSYFYDASAISKTLVRFGDVKGKKLHVSITGCADDNFDGTGALCSMSFGIFGNVTDYTLITDSAKPRCEFSLNPQNFVDQYTFKTDVDIVEPFKLDNTVTYTDDDMFGVSLYWKHATASFTITEISITVS